MQGTAPHQHVCISTAFSVHRAPFSDTTHREPINQDPPLPDQCFSTLANMQIHDSSHTMQTWNPPHIHTCCCKEAPSQPRLTLRVAVPRTGEQARGMPYVLMHWHQGSQLQVTHSPAMPRHLLACPTDHFRSGPSSTSAGLPQRFRMCGNRQQPLPATAQHIHGSTASRMRRNCHHSTPSRSTQVH